MKEGLIIKLYRERAGLTQKQLGEGICSVTHVSKIELGNTQYSPEITNLICKRLNIDIEKELQQYEQLRKKLYGWLEAMVKQQKELIEHLKKEIEQNTLIHISDIQPFYQTLLARYFLTLGNFEKGKVLLEKCQSKWNDIDRYDKHLLDHTWGIYYLLYGKSKKAIEYLKKINPMEYNNHEFYYHLACAAHFIHAKVTAYHYGSLALSYFRNTNNFKRILDTEKLMLIQMGTNDIFLMEDAVNKFHSLIKSCSAYNDEATEINLWYNLGVEYFKNKFYQEAFDAFKKVLDMCKKKPLPHLEITALNGYIQASFLLGGYDRTELEKLIAHGIALAKKKGDENYQQVFHLLEIRLNHGTNTDYFHFLETSLFPLLRDTGNQSLLSTYARELFHHYRSTSQYKEASELAFCNLDYLN
ncbi:MAG: helix-turn-helix domain-containing protein [Bacillota bacterium]